MKIVHVLPAICLLLGLSLTDARADQAIAGKDVTFGGSTPMQAFLRESEAPNGAIHFDMWEVLDGQPVRNYDIDMTKIMHMIVVSDDLTDFQHVHPVLRSDGHLAIDLHLSEHGLYHVYIDGIPHSAGRHVFRFDVPSGTTTPAAKRQFHAAGASVKVGPYTVVIDPTSVPAGEIATIDVHIFENGRPATDLHPYLGVMAHGVFIGTSDLAYMHGHGMTAEMLDMNSGNDCGDSMMAAMTPMPPDLNIGSTFEFQLLAPSSQDYDFWMQFIGGKTLYTAPFLITTR